MIGKQDSIIEKIYREITHIIDDVYRSKGLSSDALRKYFSIKKNFKVLVGKLKELKPSYDEEKIGKSFDIKVREILDKVLLDRIYYEKDRPKNESLVKNYFSFITENINDPYNEENWEEEDDVIEDKGQKIYDQIRALREIEVDTNSGKWKFYYDAFCGCVNWWNEKLGISIYATPYYENRNHIPIEASDNEGFRDIDDEIKLEGDIITLEEYKNMMINWINLHDDYFKTI
jgi:hypothetical protein